MLPASCPLPPSPKIKPSSYSHHPCIITSFPQSVPATSQLKHPAGPDLSLKNHHSTCKLTGKPVSYNFFLLRQHSQLHLTQIMIIISSVTHQGVACLTDFIYLMCKWSAVSDKWSSSRNSSQTANFSSTTRYKQVFSDYKVIVSTYKTHALQLRASDKGFTLSH